MEVKVSDRVGVGVTESETVIVLDIVGVSLTVAVLVRVALMVLVVERVGVLEGGDV